MAAYPPQQFATQSLDAAIDIARAGKFATIIHADGDVLTTVHAPLTVVEGPDGVSFVGHIVRSNPLCRVLDAGNATVRLTFLPADGYVSPRVYAEKGRSGKVVPTWNYVAAHLDGDLALVNDPAELLDILDRQSEDYEGASDGSWRVGDAPDDYIDAMVKAIAGVRFVPRSGLAITKLSQNKPADLTAIGDWFSNGAPAVRTVAYWIRRFAGN